MESQEIVTISKAEYNAMQHTITALKFELSELKRLIFGAKSEKHHCQIDNQPTLFELPKEEVIETQTEEITYTRKKTKTKKQAFRLELPAHLPRKTEIINPEFLPENAVYINSIVTEILEYEPANIFVRRIVRNKYKIAQTDEKTSIIIADLPSLPIPKSNAGASMLAHILISKFVDHLPFYRQSQIFKRQKLNIPESTMGGWFSASCRLLEPLYEVLKKKVLSTDYIMADETPIPVQTHEKQGATHKGYHWVYCDPVKKLVLIDYQKSRAREGPNELLKKYKGYLQTDGYTAYNNLSNQLHITQLACMAHARRKFEHAKDNDRSRSDWALRMIGKLYVIEDQAQEKSLSPEAIKDLRQKESKPILMEIETWLNENLNQTLPQSPIGKAIAYTLTLWPRLKRYIEDGRFHIDNNLIENSIRPIALGRKNYLFAGSHKAAQQAAIIYSLLATCKLNDIEPYQWLMKTLSVIPETKLSQLPNLLPIGI